ncbi:hypothetical protein ACPCIR_12645 [Mycobacterium sp. NPDC051198]
MWSTTPPALIAKPGWTTDPSLPTAAGQHWAVSWTRRAIDSGIGSDAAVADALWIPGSDTGLGADRAVLAAVGSPAAETGLGADRGLIVPDLYTVDAGIGADLARPGVRPVEAGAGADLCQSRSRYAAIDRAVGADMLTSLKSRTPVRDTGLGNDSAASGFTAIAVVTASWALAGTYTFTIPLACRYIDVVLLGAGGGGASSGTFYTLGGYPGEAGLFATVTLERGVHIPWTAITITITVGVGGARGSGGFAGTAGSVGGSTVLTYTNLSGATVTLTATGGAGGIANLTGTSDNTGRSPGSLTYKGQPYAGGAAQSTTGATGNPPGGGGAGGKNFGGAGGVGAPGGAWCRAYQ